jgi:hypothetical protein
LATSQFRIESSAPCHWVGGAGRFDWGWVAGAGGGSLLLGSGSDNGVGGGRPRCGVVMMLLEADEELGKANMGPDGVSKKGLVMVARSGGGVDSREGAAVLLWAAKSWGDLNSKSCFAGDE